MVAAQTSAIQLSDSQKTKIYESLKAPEGGIGVETQPALTAGENFRVGAMLAPDVELLEIPPATIAEVPAVQGFKYTVVGEEVGLVDPKSRRIVTILR